MPGCGGEAQHGVQEEQAERCWPQELQAAALLPSYTLYSDPWLHVTNPHSSFCPITSHCRAGCAACLCSLGSLGFIKVKKGNWSKKIKG